jgi:hypothetical protein
VVPFGLTNAPAVFCAMMNRIFGPLLDVCVIAHMDDVVGYSKSIEDHIEHLKRFFKLLTQHCLFLKLVKCTFMQPEVEFCGHIVGVHGLRLTENKIKAMQARPNQQMCGRI